MPTPRAGPTPSSLLRLRRWIAPALLACGGLALVALLAVRLRLGLGVSILLFVALAALIAWDVRTRRALAEASAIGNDMRLAIDTIPTIVWTTSADGTVDFMNRAWRDFTGADYSAGRWVETLHPDEAAWVQSTRNAAVAAGRAYELDARLRQADGTYRWVLRRAVPLRNERGEIIRWYGTGTDIDDLKRAEVALRESEAYLAEAQRLSRTGSFGWDLARAELRWSEETFRIFEYDPRSDTPTVEHVLRRVHPDDLAAVQSAIDRITHDKQDWDLDHRLLMPDGRVKHVRVVARAARHSGGVEFIGAIMDVTATRRAQLAARRARERALAARFAAALEERTRLAREIHDTLLQGFTGVALQLTAVARRAGDPETAAALGAVIAQAERTLDDARQAVWDLRAPAPAAGGFPAAVRELAEQAVRGTGLALELEVSGVERPLPAEVEGAAARVLQESIANIVKHAGARTVSVELAYRRGGARLTVTDDGKGFQVDPAFRAYGGHWGLLGMRERAAELRGGLTVRSAPGQGTTVTLRLPCRERSAVTAAQG